MFSRKNSNKKLAELGKYIALAKLRKDEEAINFLVDFEKENGIGFFHQTIEELLEGLENDFMTKYEVQIKEVADKYSITIIPGAST